MWEAEDQVAGNNGPAVRSIWPRQDFQQDSVCVQLLQGEERDVQCWYPEGLMLALPQAGPPYKVVDFSAQSLH